MANERNDAFDSTGIDGLSQERDFETGATGTGQTITSDTGSDQPITARAREAVSTAGHRAVERVQERFADQVSRATGQLESVASSLRTAGEQMPDEGIGRYMVQAATQVDNLASFLNNREVSDLVDEVEAFARRQPAVFLGGAFALGVLGARFLRSSRQNMSMNYDRAPREGFFEGSYEDGQPTSSTTFIRGTDDSGSGYSTGYDGGSNGLRAGFNTGSPVAGDAYSGAGTRGRMSTGQAQDLASDLPAGSRRTGSSTGERPSPGVTGSSNLVSGGSTIGRDDTGSTGGAFRSASPTRDAYSARPASEADRELPDSDFDERSPDFL